MDISREIERYFQAARKLTLEAGKLIKAAIEAEKNVMAKGNQGDIVTANDQEVEKILISGLSSEFPEHKFMAEESAENSPLILTDVPTWIIDPIDGTMNFVHSFPQCCISVALAINKILEVGIVYNPCNEELYTARRGQGAFLNGKPLKASGVTELSEALMIIEPGMLRRSRAKRDITKGRMEVLCTLAGGIRNVGSAALGLAYVARGIIDIFHIDYMQPWDVAAGFLLVSESGGIVIDTKGGPPNLLEPLIIASGTRQLAQEVSQLLVETDLKIQRKRLQRT
ncbi:inositol monophosphatase 2-like [Fopius arisanus]|uniref:Inositol-1-monophosphatase n=2 Tax=Fopius arisanus TaxID=64838 RepID=A0A9R1T3K9_9HYME|nr:PREDICTED: inositol monophosphatase 2-like [Fopius arisanus]XP_011302311.1 PREDICTED: inositol monophosphatase 2-like [Fopius arisanus]XP_011302312.1 PREDICTED: inositol monophosphatase 2-like [Fopius arisanus]